MARNNELKGEIHCDCGISKELQGYAGFHSNGSTKERISVHELKEVIP